MRGVIGLALAVGLVLVGGVLFAIPDDQQAAFPEPIAVEAPTTADLLPVSVRVSGGTVGSVRTASLRGGQASATAPRNSDAGLVGFSKNSARAAKATTRSSATATARPKRAMRQASIGGAGEQHSGTGLADRP